MKSWHSYHLLKIIQRLNFVGLFVGIGLLVYFASAWYLTLTLISVLLISKVGHSIGQHRYFCHKAFTTGRIRHWLIALCATLSTTSSSIHYAAVHRYHHAHSDKETDLHDPKKLGFWKTFFLSMPKKTLEAIPRTIIKDLLRDKAVMFFHNWYWPTILIYVGVLALIDPTLVVLCYMVPAGYSKLISGVQLTFVHMHGYRNFETSDNSMNNLFWNWVTLGEGLHNNHHARPGEFRFDFTKKPGEFDFAGWVIEKVFNTRQLP